MLFKFNVILEPSIGPSSPVPDLTEVLSELPDLTDEYQGMHFLHLTPVFRSRSQNWRQVGVGARFGERSEPEPEF